MAGKDDKQTNNKKLTKKREEYRRNKCINDYATINCFTNTDVINLMNNKQLCYHEQGNTVVPNHLSRMINVQITRERYDQQDLGQTRLSYISVSQTTRSWRYNNSIKYYNKCIIAEGICYDTTNEL